MIYRGQKYGDPIGRWWTSSREEANKFAMSRGGNRNWVVLALDEDDMTWLSEHRTYERAGDERGDWYDISLEQLNERWSGVRIIDGAIDLGTQTSRDQQNHPPTSDTAESTHAREPHPGDD